MSQTITEQETVQTLTIVREVQIAAPAEIAFEAVLAELGPEGVLPDGNPAGFKFEAWPGGRWYRDLGNNTGHLWAHVQVIKPPKLLELYGPMPMSYPAANFIQYRFTSEGSGTRLKFTHRAMGLIPQEHREGMPQGWEFMLNRMREQAERKVGQKGGKR
jgi:uncharacterized protein YndB with AHSA1/START domain